MNRRIWLRFVMAFLLVGFCVTFLNSDAGTKKKTKRTAEYYAKAQAVIELRDSKKIWIIKITKQTKDRVDFLHVSNRTGYISRSKIKKMHFGKDLQRLRYAKYKLLKAREKKVVPKLVASATTVTPEKKKSNVPVGKRPVKVFILSGQSNMCGMGKSSSLKGLPESDEKYKYLIDPSGKWAVRDDVYYLYALMGKTDNLKYSGWLTVGSRLGPEVGIGHMVGDYLDEMAVLIKACCGNRSLGYDVTSPSSRKRLGITEKGGKWYCGICYDNWTKGSKTLLNELQDRVPPYKGQGYEVAGFFWWQGHKDRGMSKEKYEKLLCELIQDWRAEFNAPKAPFVVATIGFSGHKLGAWKGVFEAQMAVGDPERHPEFKDNVASVDIRDIGGGGFHYGCNGATYAKVGDAMGRAMVELLKKKE